ncbi:hypothetical protein GFL84_09165 [Rhizobium leguminosarum bv. viciae]|nr:hypothetical protein [Rhizobium leguminosarum bv. viciae]
MKYEDHDNRMPNLLAMVQWQSCIPASPIGKVQRGSAVRSELFLNGRPARIDGGLDYVPRY